MYRRHRIVMVAALLGVLSLVAAAPSAASLAAPTPDTTSNGVPLPAFHWTAVSGAGQYQFQLSAASDFSGTLMDAYTKNTYYTMVKTEPDASYFWRVRAITTAGAAGPWSSVVEWDKSSSSPVMVSPGDTDTITYPDPVVLHWLPLDGAAKYELMIGDDVSLSGATPIETSATSYSPPAWLSPGQHWWAVAAKDAEGALTPYSTPISFTWDWPSTVSGLTVTDGVDGTGDPVADDAIFEPRFSWDAVPGAARYDLDLSTRQQLRERLDHPLHQHRRHHVLAAGAAVERRLLLARPGDRPEQRQRGLDVRRRPGSPR